MAKYSVEETTLINIANAIRSKTNKMGGMRVDEMAAEIDKIEAGKTNSKLAYLVSKDLIEILPKDMEGAERIGAYSFYGCAGLKHAGMPEGVAEICEHAFANCVDLATVVITKTVTRIGYYAFVGCNSLKTIYFTGTEAEWNAIEKSDIGHDLNNVEIIFDYIDVTACYHNWLPATCHAPQTCTKCGFTEGDPLSHIELIIPRLAPTCTAEGHEEYRYCELCGDVFVPKVVIPAAGHTEVIDEAVAPTYTTTGLTEGKHCSVCGEVLVRQLEVPCLPEPNVVMFWNDGLNTITTEGVRTSLTAGPNEVYEKTFSIQKNGLVGHLNDHGWVGMIGAQSYTFGYEVNGELYLDPTFAMAPGADVEAAVHAQHPGATASRYSGILPVELLTQDTNSVIFCVQISDGITTKTCPIYHYTIEKVRPKLNHFSNDQAAQQHPDGTEYNFFPICEYDTWDKSEWVMQGQTAAIIDRGWIATNADTFSFYYTVNDVKYEGNFIVEPEQQLIDALKEFNYKKISRFEGRLPIDQFWSGSLMNQVKFYIILNNYDIRELRSYSIGVEPGHLTLPATCEVPECCMYCGQHFGLPLGHLVESTIPAVEPTCTTSGWTEGGVCSRCGINISRHEVPALGHDYVNPGDTCSRCGEMKYSDCLIFTDINNETCSVAASPAAHSAKAIYIPPVSPDGKTVVSIGNSAFFGCIDVNSISIPDGVINIGSGAFDECGLKSITIPDSVVSIGNSAFHFCKGLTSVIFGENSKLTSIGDFAFHFCRSLTNIIIPDTVTSIGNGAFSNCDSLTDIYYRGTIEQWNAINKANAKIPGSATVYYLGEHYSVGLVYINNTDGTCSVRGIGSCTDTDINIPPVSPDGKVVTNIDDFAFFNNSSLTSIIIPNKVTSIGKSAFNSCYSLTSISIPDSVMNIGNSAFNSCHSLTSITLPDGVTSIGEFAFSSCSRLTSIIIPGSVTSIGEYIFNTCSSLTDIYYEGTYEQWNAIDKTNADIPESATIHYNGERYSVGLAYTNNDDGMTCSVSSIGTCTDTDIIIPPISPEGRKVVSIGDSAFFNNIAITSITIPDGVITIGKEAFRSCSSLTNVIVPDDVTNIGEGAFWSCPSLISILIPEGVANINDKTFCGCSSLAGITIPNGVTDIGRSAFQACTSLTNITIPDGVTHILFEAFGYCTSLESIVIPDSLTRVGQAGFYKCNHLTDVYYTGTKEQWSSIDIDSSNEPLLNATIHYNYNPEEVNN